MMTRDTTALLQTDDAPTIRIVAVGWSLHQILAPYSPEEQRYPLDGFFEEACSIEADARTGAKELHQHYRAWAERHGLRTQAW